jgi:hypothetical protein
MIAMFFPLMLQVQRRRSVFRSGGLVSFHPVAHRNDLPYGPPVLKICPLKVRVL